MNKRADFWACILIGGRGRRLGGTEKSQLTISHNGQTQTFLERLIEELQQDKIMTVLSGRKTQTHSKLEVIEDQFENQGPLGGLYSVFQKVPAQWIFLLACDMPYFRAPIIHELFAKIEKDTLIVLPTSNGVNHPTAAFYNRRLAPLILAQLKKNQCSFQSLFQMLPQETVEQWGIPTKWLGAFKNINRLVDLKLD